MPIPTEIPPDKAAETVMAILDGDSVDDLLSLLAGTDRSRAVLGERKFKLLARKIVLRLAGLMMRPDFLPLE